MQVIYTSCCCIIPHMTVVVPVICCWDSVCLDNSFQALRRIFVLKLSVFNTLHDCAFAWLLQGCRAHAELAAGSDCLAAVAPVQTLPECCSHCLSQEAIDKPSAALLALRVAGQSQSKASACQAAEVQGASLRGLLQTVLFAYLSWLCN